MSNAKQIHTKCCVCGFWKIGEGELWVEETPHGADEDKNVSHTYCPTCFAKERTKILAPRSYGLNARPRLHDDAPVQCVCRADHPTGSEIKAGLPPSQDVRDESCASGPQSNDGCNSSLPRAIRAALSWLYPDLNPQEEIYHVGYVLGVLTTVIVIVMAELLLFAIDTAATL